LSFPDWSLILDNIVALAVVLAPLEVFILRNLLRFRLLVTSFIGLLSAPDGRKQIFSELGHGIFRALSERAGSQKGVEARQGQALGISNLVSGAGGIEALGAIKGKIDVPFLGKVTPIEALQAFIALKNIMGGGGSNIMQNLTGAVNQSSGSSSGALP